MHLASGSGRSDVASVGLPFASILFRIVTTLRLARSPSKDALSIGTLQLLSMRGADRVTSLAAHMGVSQPGMTQLVDRLEARGEVRRVRDGVDGRVVLVDITPGGEQRLAAALAEVGDDVSTLLGQLSKSDRRQISESLAALEALATAGLLVVAGPEGALR